jgi:hypothetical protein
MEAQRQKPYQPYAPAPVDVDGCRNTVVSHEPAEAFRPNGWDWKPGPGLNQTTLGEGDGKL